MLYQYQQYSLGKCHNFNESSLQQCQTELSFQDMFQQFRQFDSDYMKAYSKVQIYKLFMICQQLILYLQNSCLKQNYFDQLSLVNVKYNKIIRQYGYLQYETSKLFQQRKNHIQKLNQIIRNRRDFQNVSNQSSKQLQKYPPPIRQKIQDLSALKNKSGKYFKFSQNDKTFISQIIENQKLQGKNKKTQEEQLKKKQDQDYALENIPFRTDKSKLCCSQYLIQDDKVYNKNNRNVNGNQNLDPSVNNLIFIASENLKTFAQTIKAVRESICGLANSKNISGGLIFIGFQKNTNIIGKQNDQIYVVKGEQISKQQKNELKKKLLKSVKAEVISKATQSSEFEGTKVNTISGIEINIDFVPIVKSIYTNYQNIKKVDKIQIKNQLFYKPNFYVIRIAVMPNIMTCKKTFIVSITQMVKIKKQKNQVRQTDSQTPPNSGQQSGMKKKTNSQIFMFNHQTLKNQKILSQKVYQLILSRYSSYCTKNIQNSNKNLSNIHLHFDKPKSPLQIQFSTVAAKQTNFLIQQFNLDSQDEIEEKKQHQNLIVFSNSDRNTLQTFLKKEKINFQISNQFQDFRRSSKTKRLYVFRHNLNIEKIEDKLQTLKLDGVLNKNPNKKIFLIKASKTIFVKTCGIVESDDWKQLSGWVKINVKERINIYRLKKTKTKQQELGYFIQTSTTKGGIFVWIFLNDKCPDWNIKLVKSSQIKNHLTDTPKQAFQKVQFEQFQMTEQNQKKES